jgi:5'-nucleotidase
LGHAGFPPGQPRGVRVTRLGRRLYSEKVVERKDPRGRRYFWIGVGPPAWEAGEDTDHAAVHAGYVSVTPLMLDLTDYPGLRGLKDWETEYRRQSRGRRAAEGR